MRSRRAARCRRATRSSSRARICASGSATTIARDRAGASGARALARRAAGSDRRRGRSPTKCSTPCRAHLIARRGGEWHERGVVDRRRVRRGTTRVRAFAWSERAGRARLAALARGALSAATATTRARSTPPPKRWSQTSAGGMAGGAALFIDYGFPAAEYYHPQRSDGHADVPLPASRARRSVRVARAAPTSPRTSISRRWRQRASARDSRSRASPRRRRS